MKTKISTFNSVSKNLAILMVLFCSAFISYDAKACHGQAAVSDIDYTGMGTFSGSYTQSGSDHVWFVFNATAGNTLSVSYSTPGFASYYWLYRAGNGTVSVGNSTSNNLTLVHQTGGGTSGSYSYSVTTTGQYALQLDAYLCGSGSYTVTLSGATNCTTITAISASGSPVYNGGVNTNLYIGYPSNTPSVQLTADGATSATWSPATYLSCSTCTTTVFSPTVAGSYTLTATCGGSSQSVTICVKDVRVPNTSGSRAKVYLCHKEPVANRSQTLAVLNRGIAAHMQHHSGDMLGNCNNTCSSNKRDMEFLDLVVDENELEITCTPNPFRQSFKLDYFSTTDEEASVMIYGMTGNLVESVSLNGFTNEIELGNSLPNGIYTVSFLQGEKTRFFRMIKVD